MLLIFDWKDQRADRLMVNYVWKVVGVCRVMKKFVVLCAIALTLMRLAKIANTNFLKMKKKRSP